MVLERHQTNRGWPDWSLLFIVLSGLIFLPTFELDSSEADLVQGALGPLEGEFRCALPDRTPPALPPVLRAWAVVVGTTERPLRLLTWVVWCLTVGVVGEVARDRRERSARTNAHVILALTPALLASLHRDVLTPLPAALMAGFGVLHLDAWRRGLWWTLGALGAFLLPAMSTTALPILLGAIGLAWLGGDWRVGSARAALAVGSFAAGIGAFGLDWRQVTSVRWAPFEEPWPVPASLALACATFLVVEPRRKTQALEVISSIALATVAPRAAVPLLASLCADSSPGRFRGVRLLGFLLALVLGLVRVEMPQRTGHEIRDVLTRARAASESGGRLIVSGPTQAQMLFYSRRGHDPGIPLLLIPQDVAIDGLSDHLRHSLRVEPGREAEAPIVLAHPADFVAPGLEPERSTTPTSPVVLRLAPQR